MIMATNNNNNTTTITTNNNNSSNNTNNNNKQINETTTTTTSSNNLNQTESINSNLNQNPIQNLTNNTNNNNNNNSINTELNQSQSNLNNQSPTNTNSNSSNNTNDSSNDNRWIFPPEKIENSPSRLDGLTLEQELNERQEAALFISDLGSLLRVNQLCINTAIIYMHRFFMIHSFKKFHRYVRMVATSCLFLACKVEEQPRRLREFIESIQNLFHKTNEPVSHTPEEYRKYAEEISALESCLLQTLGFNILINHAHTFIIKTCQMIKAPRDLAEAAYLTATNSLILTNFCVKFSSEKIACFCIYLACKWTALIIPTSSEGLQWYQYVKHDIVEQELEDISKEYLTIYDKCLPIIQKKLGKTKNTDDSSIQPNQTRQSHHPQQRQQQQQYQNIKKTHHDMHPPQQNVNKQQLNPHHHQQQQHKNQNGHHNYQQNGPQQITQKHQSHPSHQPQRPTQQQQQQQYQNKNPTSQPIHKQSQQPTQPIKHPSTSNLNPNKSNGTSNQNGSMYTQNSIDANKNFYMNKKPSVSSSNLSSLNGSQTSIKMSPSTPSSSATATASSTTTSMKRGNEELNNITTAPNKIPKYIIDQKSAS